jgi:hypothetical protein
MRSASPLPDPTPSASGNNSPLPADRKPHRAATLSEPVPATAACLQHPEIQAVNATPTGVDILQRPEHRC